MGPQLRQLGCGQPSRRNYHSRGSDLVKLCGPLTARYAWWPSGRYFNSVFSLGHVEGAQPVPHPDIGNHRFPRIARLYLEGPGHRFRPVSRLQGSTPEWTVLMFLPPAGHYVEVLLRGHCVTQWVTAMSVGFVYVQACGTNGS